MYSKWSLSYRFTTKTLFYVFRLFYIRATSSCLDLPEYLMRTKNHEPPHYVVFFSLLILLPLRLTNIFPSTLYKFVFRSFSGCTGVGMYV
jgi:hypothetical protein